MIRDELEHEGQEIFWNGIELYILDKHCCQWLAQKNQSWKKLSQKLLAQNLLARN